MTMSKPYIPAEAISYCNKQKQQLKRLVIAGGVSANQTLRQQLEGALAKQGASVYYAPPQLCTDNGAMIAYAGYYRLKAGQSDGLSVQCVPRWGMQTLRFESGYTHD